MGWSSTRALLDKEFIERCHGDRPEGGSPSRVQSKRFLVKVLTSVGALLDSEFLGVTMAMDTKVGFSSKRFKRFQGFELE